MGLVGAALIARWTVGLLRDTGKVLLDAEVETAAGTAITEAIQGADDNQVVDLHLWRVGPRHMAAIISLVTHHPRTADHYKDLLAGFDDLVHVTVEVHHCDDDACPVAPKT